MYGGEVSVQCGSIPEGKLGCIELFSLLCLCFLHLVWKLIDFLDQLMKVSSYCMWIFLTQ